MNSTRPNMTEQELLTDFHFRFFEGLAVFGIFLQHTGQCHTVA